MKGSITMLLTLCLTGAQFCWAGELSQTFKWIQEAIVLPGGRNAEPLIEELIKRSTDARGIYKALGLSEGKNLFLKDALLVRVVKSKTNAIKQFVMISGLDWGAKGIRVHIASTDLINMSDLKYGRYLEDINYALWSFTSHRGMIEPAPFVQLKLRLVESSKVTATVQMGEFKGTLYTYEFVGLEHYNFDKSEIEEILKIIAEQPVTGMDRFRLF